MLRIADCIAHQHHPALVILATIVCVLSSLSALVILSRRTGRMIGRLWWAAGAGMCFGCGVWATHFIAMLAFDAPVAVGYDLTLTFGSILVAITGATLAFAVADVGLPSKLLGGLILGASVAGMHWIGMTALQFSGFTLYDRSISLQALSLGMVCAVLAVIHERPRSGALRHAVTTLLLVFCVIGLHFTAMSGTTLVPGPATGRLAGVVQPELLATAIAAITTLILMFGLFTALFDRRADAEASRIRELASSTFEGILIHRSGIILDTNEAFERMVGLGVGPVGYRSILDFVQPADEPTTPSQIVQMTEGQREVVVITTEGARIPAEILARQITRADGPAVVFALRDLTERRTTEERVRFLAHHDTLTGLPNRALLSVRLLQALETAEKNNGGIAVICFDLDRFKAVNDLLGHEGGDRLLVLVARRLEECVRAGDTVARLGGDEFAVVVPRLNGSPQAEALAQRIVDMMSRPFDVEGVRVSVGASAGVARFPEDGAMPEDLMRNADTALYCAKEAGRGTHRLFEPAMERRMIERRQMERDLRAAVDEGQLHLAYQPIMDCPTNKLLGYEALVRWDHPRRGRVLPSEFIPLAEETGIILAIGRWVLRAACIEAASWHDPLSISVNLSPVQFRQPDLLQMFVETLEESGLDPARLEVEVTEGVLIADADNALTVFEGIRSLGVKIALDDFGSGYSSMSYLRQFRFDKIKIDRAFVHGLGDDREAQAIVDAILALARGLRMDVTAEGVETERQLEQLRKRNCHQVQGYLLGIPMPASELADRRRHTPNAPDDQLTVRHDIAREKPVHTREPNLAVSAI